MLVLAFLGAVAGCKDDIRTQRLDRLQAQLDADRPMLTHAAETSDPARADLKATFVESSIMEFRQTSNPDRPWVAYIRIHWKFAHADGRPVGDAVWDYIYAMEPSEKWIKADEAVPGASALPSPPALPAITPASAPNGGTGSGGTGNPRHSLPAEPSLSTSVIRPA
jgi:hypothetical protein